MKSFFSMLLLLVVGFFACRLYMTNKDVQKAVDSAFSATRHGVKVCLKKGSESL